MLMMLLLSTNKVFPDIDRKYIGLVVDLVLIKLIFLYI